MSIIRSGADATDLTVDTTSKAARVTLYDSAGRELSLGSKATYMASNTFTPVATPTDLVIIGGSGTKTVRVTSFKITTTNTAAGSQTFFLIKRSTANAGGTFVAGTAVPFDSNDAAATATVGHYTTNPTLGTGVGTIVTARTASPVLVPATFAGIVQDAGYDLLQFMDLTSTSRLVTLRGTAQQLCLNFSGAALVAGQIHAWQIAWTEE